VAIGSVHADAPRLFVDRLTPAQLEAIGDAADVVLAAFDESGAPADR
jgi:hypothetical protein